MTRKQMEEKYNLHIFKDFGYDDSRKYWVAIPKKGDKRDIYEDGWTLKEIEEKLKKLRSE